MLDTEKVDCEMLADIVFAVQCNTGYHFDLMEVFEVIRYTIRKTEVVGQNESYIPLLLRTELEDFVMRKRINLVGRINECAKCAG